jgi:hypothetical protein
LRSLTTHLRLSRPEVNLINIGFDCILYRTSDLSLQCYDSGLLAYIREVASEFREVAIRPPAATHRLKLDAMGCAMCIFALRLFQREIRRDKLSSYVWPPAINRERLLKKLERHRKRAKRKWLSQGDAASYQDWGMRLRRFLGWVKEALRPVHIHAVQDSRHRWLDRVFATVKQLLTTATDEDLPGDRELRKLVRKMMRHLRRGRGFATPLDIHSVNDRGRRFITWYMVKEIAEYWAAMRATSSPEMLIPSPTA